MPKPDIFARRQKILTGQRPAVEYQSQEALSVGHARQLHNQFDLELHDIKAIDTEFLDFEDFKRGVLYGKIKPPVEWAKKFPGFFDQAKLVIDTKPPQTSPIDEEIYWVHTPNGKSAADSSDDYTVWYKPAGSTEFKQGKKGKPRRSVFSTTITSENILWEQIHFFLSHSEKKSSEKNSFGSQAILAGLKIAGDFEPGHFEYHLPPTCRDGFREEEMTARVTETLQATWNNWLGRFDHSFGSNYDTYHSLFQSPQFSSAYQTKIKETLENPLVRKISLSAINKLLAHLDQTQYGLDHKHLMNGLVLQSNQLNYFPNIDTLAHKSTQHVEATAAWITEKDEKLPTVSFDGNEQAWWKYLYETHCHYHQLYHAGELLRIYKNFLKFIHEQSLTLPDAKFTGACNIRSLPLTLGRIMTILENCSAADRQHQLNHIAALDLGPHGAIRAVIEPKLPHYQHCRFVHPDMRCNTDHFTHDAYVTSEKYNAKMNIHTFQLIYMAFAECRDEEKHKASNVKEAFWRYVAHNQGLSLSFYEQALAHVETITSETTTAIMRAEKNVAENYSYMREQKKYVDPPSQCPFIKANLYSLLAGLTTGHNFKYCRDPNAVLQQWQRLCQIIIRITIKYDYPGLLEKLRALPILPPLDLLEKILLRYDKASERLVQGTKIEHVDHGIYLLDNLLNKLKNAEIDPTIVFQGLTHFAYDEKKQSFSQDFTDPKKALFKDWMKYFHDIAAPGIEEKIVTPMRDGDAISFGIALAHFFSLTPTETTELCDLIDERKLSPLNHRFQKNCFKLLRHLQKGTRELKKSDLENIRGKIAKLMTKDAITNNATLFIQLNHFIDYLQQNYGDCFLPDFLANKKLRYVEKSKAIDSEIKLLIAKKINTSQQKIVKDIIYHHAHEASPLAIAQFINYVADLTVLYEMQGNNFIDCLHRLADYANANARHMQHTLKDLNALFDTILTSANLTPLESILYRPDIEKIPGLIQKISTVYQLIGPWLDRNHPRISEQLTYGPMVEVVIAIPQDELERFLKNAEITLKSEAILPDEKEKDKKGPDKTRENYQDFILSYYQRIYALIEAQPIIKNDLLNYVSCFARSPAERKDMTYAKCLALQIDSLEIAKNWLTGDQLRKLLHHSNDRPHHLIACLQAVQQIEEAEGLKQQLTILMAKLINETTLDADGNEIPVMTLDSFSQLCAFINKHYKNRDGKEIANQLLGYYNWPPYRELGPLLQIANDFNGNNYGLIQFHLLNQEDTFHTASSRRSSENQFVFEDAKKQARKFSKNTHLTDPILRVLDTKLKFYRTLSTLQKNEHLRALKQSLSEQKPLQAAGIADLTALLTELVFSTTGQEFNHTQILALYSQLVANGNVTHQISTGAGKSRIGMALAAGKTILGMKVDFATENMKLAERDYYKYKAFFNACEIETLLLDADTSVDYYLSLDNDSTKSVVGFSCKQQLGLFHNKLKTKVDIDLATNRVIIIDEGDTFYCDNESLKLNLAVNDDQDTGDTRWSYSLIYEFIQRPEFADEYLDKKNSDLAKNSAHVFTQLRNYINQKTSSLEKQRQFAKISDETLEGWLRAAIIASKLEDGVDFDADIAQDVTMLTDKGLRVGSKAFIKIDNVVSTDSIYSEAVQPFLHVRLNSERREKQQKNLKTSKTPYYVEQLNEVVYSSSASTLLNDYQQKLGLTGTSGSPSERHEMYQRYRMEFIDVPDHHPSQRIDLMVHLVKDEKQKTAALKQYHRETVAQNRGHLIFSKNDNTAKALAAELQTITPGTVQRIDGTLAGYNTILANASKPQTTTLATDAWGRGTDIHSTDAAQGLAVTISYFPKNKRARIQLGGRTARYKMPGSARLVLSVDELQSDITRGKFNANDLYYNRDDLIKRLQLKTEQNEQRLRSFNIIVNGCFDHIQADFFKRCHQANIDLKTVQSEWGRFLKDLNEYVRTPACDYINSALEDEKLSDENILQALIDVYQSASDGYRDFLQDKLKTLTELDKSEFKSSPIAKEKVLKQMRPVEIDLPSWTKTYGQYDPAHAGQNVVYHKTFAETRWLWGQYRQGKISTFRFIIKLATSRHKSAARDGHGLARPEWEAFWANKRGFLANTYCAFFRGDLNAEWQALENAYVELSLLAKQLENENEKAVQKILQTVKTNATRTSSRAQIQLFTQQLIEAQVQFTPPINSPVME